MSKTTKAEAAKGPVVIEGLHLERFQHYAVESAHVPDEKITRRAAARTRQLDDVVQAAICERLMNGETLTKICNDPRMPSKVMVVRWLYREPEFREAYYQARRVQAEVVLDEILDIADDTSADVKDHTLPNGVVVKKVDNEAIQRSRVRIDTRKWIASKMIPKLYGDKVIQEHDVTGDLAKLLANAVNKDIGLPNKKK